MVRQSTDEKRSRLMKPTKQGITSPKQLKRVKALEPKTPYLAAVNKLAQKVQILPPTFDAKGYLRTLTADSNVGLLPETKFVSPEAHAQAFLSQPEIHNGL